MNTRNRLHSHAPIWQALLDQAPYMSFYRFCELLELGFPEAPPLGTTDSPSDDPVRFRSYPGLGFPAREIETIEQEGGDPRPAVHTTFLGLYGVDARMPSYFLDEVAQHLEGAEPLAAFLDIFHHRIVTQYFRIWRKYHYPVGFRADGSDAVSSYLLSLCGLGFGQGGLTRDVGVRKLLSMLALVSQKTRTTEGLIGILHYVVPDASITVDEFHPTWVTVDHDESMTLGDGCVLGGGFFDRSNSLRVIIVPANVDVVAALMPGQATHEAVMQLLRFYVGYTAQAELEMHASISLMPTSALETRAISLGYTSMLAPPDGGNVQDARVRIRLGTWNQASRR